MHRDIKPANILMEATGTGRPHLRLSDFGISMRKGEPRLTETNYVVGTPGYFAPEQMMGAEPDFPADLFAVGLVALYLLQGKKPDSQALVEHFASFGTPSAPQGIPEPLWQVLAGLLQPDPQARFRTATGARKALTAAVEMLPEPGIGEEPVEVFDQIGPLPAGFGPTGPEQAPQPQAPQPQVPQPAAQPSGQQATGQQSSYAQPPAAMSETGSFHLPPPPQHSAPAPQAPHPLTPHPATHTTAPFPAAVPDPSQAPTSAVQHEQQLTRAYTAQHQQAPVAAASHTPSPTPHTAPQTRPGPSPKVAVPVLLVALICFAVGIWALTQA